VRAYMLLCNPALSQATYPPSETKTAQIKWQNFFLFKLINSNRKDTKDHQMAWGKKTKKSEIRRASQQQIDFAKALAKSKKIPEPDHLYDHHISLAGWTWSYRGKT
jgi:hypothetical protein